VTIVHPFPRWKPSSYTAAKVSATETAAYNQQQAYKIISHSSGGRVVRGLILLLCRSSVSIWEMGEQWSLIKSSERELFRSTRLWRSSRHKTPAKLAARCGICAWGFLSFIIGCQAIETTFKNFLLRKCNH